MANAESGGQHTAAEDSHLRRDMGVVGLLFSAVGSIIGSGWLFGALNAAEIAGPASILAWGIGGLMIIFIGLCYAELGTMFPVSGGVVRFPHFSHGSFASYTLGWITWIAAASTTSIEVMAAIQYSTNYLPWLENPDTTLTLPGFAVAIGLLAIFTIINVFGIRWFARLNNLLVWWKLFIIILVIVAFLVTAQVGKDFAGAMEHGFVPMGWSGVFSSIATAGIVFSYLGFRQGVELAGETHNPQRNVPLAIIGSVAITAVIYVALQVAFIGALPESALANGWANVGNFGGGVDVIATKFGPLAALAGIMGMTWLAVLLYIDAVISPADTGLIYTTVTTRLAYAMGRNGNAPRSLAKVTEGGVPWVSLILTFIVGGIFLLPFPSWQKLVSFVTAATVLSFGSGPVALLSMRRQLPDEKRPFRLPWVKALAYLGFLSSNLIVYWSGWNKVWILMVTVLIGYLVLALHEARFHRFTPRLDIRSGLWVIVWLVGLTLISWLGIYPEDAAVGQQNILDLGWSFVVLALFSAVILWLAVSTRLSGDEAAKHLREPATLYEQDGDAAQ